MKVIILAYDFPPFGSVGGLRPYSWFRYLKNFDIVPVVVTRQWENKYGDERDYVASSPTTDVEVEESDLGTIIRTPYSANLSNRLLLAGGPAKNRIVRKMITAWFELGQYYAPIGTKVELYHAARRYLSDNKAEAIIATGGPFVLFRYAGLLSREFGVPWVADYRDPWSQDRRLSRLLRGWSAKLERRLTSSASVITTVSEFMRDLLSGLHPGRPIEIVANGYDPAALATAQSIQQGQDRFTIAFAGTTCGFHPVESVFRVLDGFIRTHPEAALALNMIGVGDRIALEELLRQKFPDLAQHVTFTGRLANDQMAVLMAKANAFLMFNMYAYSGTKVFDYLALRRKILLCYSDDPEARRLKKKYYNVDVLPGGDEHVLERMVEDAKAGVVVRDAAHLRELLTDLHREFKDTGRIACEPVGVEKYSRRARAEEMASVLKRLVG